MFVAFFAVWVVLNGRFDAEICIFGAVISAALSFFCARFLDRKPHFSIGYIKNIPLGIAYVGILIAEIVSANLKVLPTVFSRYDRTNAALVRFDVPLENSALRVLLANSITLTPGTITVRLDDEGYLVHCLRSDFAEGIESSRFVRLLMKMEKNLGKTKKEGQ